MSEQQPEAQPPEAPQPATAKAAGWGRWLDAALLVGVGGFLLYRFVGTGLGSGSPTPVGVAVLPPGDRPSFVELSSTR